MAAEASDFYYNYHERPRALYRQPPGIYSSPAVHGSETAQ